MIWLKKLLAVVLLGLALSARGDSSLEDSFRLGVEEYRAGDFETAAKLFGECAAGRPGSGALHNLGLAEWRRDRVGEAILAWERAVWLDPANRPARASLRHARQTAQLESPMLAWYEAPSTWLSVNAWAWIGGMSLWLAAGMMTLPGLLRWRRAAWQQAVAATALAVFLFCVPAQIGGHTRARIGFVIGPGAALRLSPTAEGETLMLVAPGESVRLERVRGNYALVRTGRSAGWLERERFGGICPR
jgi:hypothetical protein